MTSPTSVVVGVIERATSTDCAICMTPVQSGARTLCGHTYHNRCLQRWLGSTLMRGDAHGSCPVCREPIPHAALVEIETIGRIQLARRLLDSVKHYGVVA